MRGGLGPRVAAAAHHKRPETTAGARDSLLSHRVLLRGVVGLNKGRKWRTGIASRPLSAIFDPLILSIFVVLTWTLQPKNIPKVFLTLFW